MCDPYVRLCEKETEWSVRINASVSCLPYICALVFFLLVDV